MKKKCEEQETEVRSQESGEKKIRRTAASASSF
jgi:hypothetical protein